MAKPPETSELLRASGFKATGVEPEPRAPGCSQEDALAYLRCSTISVFRKGEVFFSPSQPSRHLFLVIDGRVKVSRISPDGQEVVVDIYQRDEFFGESAFVGLDCQEKATSLEDTQVMTWTVGEVEESIQKKPRLGLALLQVLVNRSLDFRYRLESLSSDSVARRLARSLIRFSERMGREQEDGSLLMAPLTHGLLAQYLGTSREIVTLFMTQFRRQGYLQYSRRGILLRRGPFEGWLRHG